MRHTFLFLSISFILFACNDDKAEKDLSIVPLTTTPSNMSDSTKGPSANNLPVQMPANAVMPQSTTSMPQNVVTSTTTAPGMNPPHGQPGHRCDVKDGAPLSTAPARVATTPNATATAPQIVSAPQPVAAAPTAATPKGMNPAHGQPGHRCDISVGAPLNSAPTTAAKPAANNATANITPMATPTQNSPVVPALQNTSITTPATKPVTAFTGKVNPAHGQPGHDCKVAVGQPLP